MAVAVLPDALWDLVEPFLPSPPRRARGGRRIEDDVLIAMGAILLNGSHIGTGSMVGAGAVVREGMKVPPNSLVLGVPGRIARSTTNEELERIRKTVQSYLDLQEQYRSG